MEVMNQQLETMLCTYVHADQKDWPQWLDVLQLAYNNTPHSSHKEAPAKLLLGFKPHSPSDLLHKSGMEFMEGLPCYTAYHREHASLNHHITFDYSLSSPAPKHKGRTLGYYDDSTTCTLLALDVDDHVMHSGTYGPKEPGVEPVDLLLLEDGLFDQCLLPFTPVNVATFLPLILHDLNGQPYLKKALVVALKEDVDQLLAEASDLGQQVGLSLPFYICEVLPKLLWEDLENSDPFTYQLCPYFLLCMHWTRINHCKIMLHAFINLCHHILHPNAAWKVRPPVSLQADAMAVSNKVLSLMCAYLFFGLPFTGFTLQPTESYSVKLAFWTCRH